MSGKPVFAPRERENVLFPDPAIPVTRTRRPTAKAASLIDISVPQVPIGAEQLFASIRAVQSPFRRARFGLLLDTDAYRRARQNDMASAGSERISARPVRRVSAWACSPSGCDGKLTG